MARFSLYPRKRKIGKPIYYAQFKIPSGKWSSAKSTGCTVKRQAEKWCEEYLDKNNQWYPSNNISFKEFSKDFFSFTGLWATDKKIRGQSIGEHHCLSRTESMKKHVIPALGNFKLHEIDRATIKEFRNNLYLKGYSGSTINQCLYAIKAVLEAAEEKGIIKAVPKIERAAERPKPKGILNLDEVKQLFSARWETFPTHCHPAKPQFMGFIGNLLAASSGIRLGELQALTLQDIHLDAGYITVRRTWDRRLNKLNESTKTGKTRTIFIPKPVQDAIRSLIKKHPLPFNPDSFLFWGEEKPDRKPAEKNVFIKAFYITLSRIGITEEKRKERNITFHSWRHFLNSLLLNAKIPLHKVQSITGHSTFRMSQHYYHLDDMADVRQIQENLFSSVAYKVS